MSSLFYQLLAPLVRRRQITTNPGDKNIRRPVSLYSLSEQSCANASFPLEKRTILLSTDSRKDAALPAILRSNSAPRLGV
jgi:hypothetical protein